MYCASHASSTCLGACWMITVSCCFTPPGTPIPPISEIASGSSFGDARKVTMARLIVHAGGAHVHRGWPSRWTTSCLPAFPDA